MPPIREHKSDSSPTHQLQNLSPGEEDIDHPSPKSDKSSSMLSADKDRNKRNKRAPSINTRASRVGVTNFINVIKSLHPGESINYFPITRDTLQEYIDSKRKALIKAGSLEQYLQHIQAYNIALGFGWDGHEFGPIIKKALDELRTHEDDAILKSGNIGNILVISSNQSQQPPTLVNSVISQQLQQQSHQSNPYLGPLDPNNFPMDTQMNLDPIIENNASSFDSIDELIPMNGNPTETRFHTSPEPLSQLSSPKTPYYKSLDTPVLKSVTVRSKTKVYKQKIAVSDTTTFSSLISFAIKVSPPIGKQFVIRTADGALEYMPDDLVREVISGVDHTEIIVSIENVGPPVDFDYF